VVLTGTGRAHRRSAPLTSAAGTGTIGPDRDGHASPILEGMSDLPPPPASIPPPPPAPAPPDGRRWRTWHVVVAAVVGLVLGVGIGGAVGEDDDPDAALQVVDDPADARDEAPTDEQRPEADEAGDDDEPTTSTTAEAKLGTRDNPYPLGTELRTEEGLVVVVDAVRFDAAAEIAATNQFNEPPPEGLQWVLMTFTIRNETDEPIHAGWALDVGLLGSANRMYDSSNSYCEAVIPNPLYDGGELFPGGSFQGNECLQVPVAEVEDGSLLLAVTPSLSFEDPVFVATR